jgi:hypothetical protein
MAKVLVEFDTVTKLLSLTMDGKVMTDIDRVEFYDISDYMPRMEESEDEAKDVFTMNVFTCTEDKANKTKTRTAIYASKASVDNVDMLVDSKVIPGMYELDPAIAGIASFLTKKKKG